MGESNDIYYDYPGPGAPGGGGGGGETDFGVMDPDAHLLKHHQ